MRSITESSDMGHSAIFRARRTSACARRTPSLGLADRPAVDVLHAPRPRTADMSPFLNLPRTRMTPAIRGANAQGVSFFAGDFTRRARFKRIASRETRAVAADRLLMPRLPLFPTAAPGWVPIRRGLPTGMIGDRKPRRRRAPMGIRGVGGSPPTPLIPRLKNPKLRRTGAISRIQKDIRAPTKVPGAPRYTTMALRRGAAIDIMGSGTKTHRIMRTDGWRTRAFRDHLISHDAMGCNTASICARVPSAQ